MDRQPDPATPLELTAYVDDQLSLDRRLAVESFLADNPDAAARVMADLRLRTELRLAFPIEHGAGNVRTSEAARRLQASRFRRRLAPRLGRIAALGLLVAFGWAAHSQFGPLGVRESVASAKPPAYVEDALRAHRTSQLRAGMVSQPETSRFDPGEILSATAILMPTLPDGWSVSDVQIFPSTFGPSVELALRTGEREALSLYAVRPGSFDVVETRLTNGGSELAAYWQIGEVAYALVAPGIERGQLGQWAGELARTLY